MTKEECEKKLVNKIKEMWDIYKEYNPEGDFINVYISNGILTINNRYYGADGNKPIDYWDHLAEEVHGEENIENHTI